MTSSEKAHAYARSVVSGEIDACKWVVAACRRHLDDVIRSKKKGGRYPFKYDEIAANRACSFIETLPHVKGRWARSKELIKLEPWQCFTECVVYGWLDKKTDLRRFRTVYIEVPRKNAKSTLSSGNGLYMVAADGEEGAEVYSAATTRDQAKIVHSIAQQMVRKSPEMQDDEEGLGIGVGARSIHVLKSGSKFEPLSAEASSLDGQNVHFGIIDELHAHKTREVFDVIETATGARDQPLVWIITTAGSNRAGICYEQRTYLTKILSGAAKDETYFGIIYTLDDDDDWTDPKVWAKANPNYGISVSPSDIARKARKAMQMPSAQNNFKTKHLNLWVNADTSWMDMLKWDKCGDPSLSVDDFAGEEMIAGLDLASKVDIAAKVQVFKRDDHFYVFGKYYLPEDTVEDSGNSQYEGWAIEARLTTTPGNVIDYEYIKEDIREDATRFDVRELPYDPYQATQLSTELAAEGLPMVEMRPSVLNFSEPMKEIEKLVLSGKLHHNGCPVMGWMISNVVCHMDAKDNIYPRKERPENKIDGVVALIMALGRWMANEDTTSVYEGRGVRSV